MLNPMHWQVTLSDPKNPKQQLDTKVSLYPYEDTYRLCFSNRKQRYYFEVLQSDYDDVPQEILPKVLNHYFDRIRHTCDVAKCVRCSKWDVVHGQFCNRCNEAMKSPALGSVELDVEV